MRWRKAQAALSALLPFVLCHCMALPPLALLLCALAACGEFVKGLLVHFSFSVYFLVSEDLPCTTSLARLPAPVPRMEAEWDVSFRPGPRDSPQVSSPAPPQGGILTPHSGLSPPDWPRPCHNGDTRPPSLRGAQAPEARNSARHQGEGRRPARAQQPRRPGSHTSVTAALPIPRVRAPEQPRGRLSPLI